MCLLYILQESSSNRDFSCNKLTKYCSLCRPTGMNMGGGYGVDIFQQFATNVRYNSRCLGFEECMYSEQKDKSIQY